MFEEPLMEKVHGFIRHEEEVKVKIENVLEGLLRKESSSLVVL